MENDLFLLRWWEKQKINLLLLLSPPIIHRRAMVWTHNFLPPTYHANTCNLHTMLIPTISFASRTAKKFLFCFYFSFTIVKVKITIVEQFSESLNGLQRGGGLPGWAQVCQKRHSSVKQRESMKTAVIKFYVLIQFKIVIISNCARPL